MLKKTITYTDYFGKEQTEDFYFNYSKAELAELSLTGPDGDMGSWLQSIVDENDNAKILQSFKDIILGAYGVRSEDGKRFIKSPELAKEFMQTAAFDKLLLSFFTDADEASAFINGMMPADLAAAVAEKRDLAETLKTQPNKVPAGVKKPTDRLPKKTKKAEVVESNTPSRLTQEEVVAYVAKNPAAKMKDILAMDPEVVRYVIAN